MILFRIKFDLLFFSHLIPQISNLLIDFQFEVYYSIPNEKSISFFKGSDKQMAVIEETSTKEKLIEFILNLTNEECEIIISYLNSK